MQNAATIVTVNCTAIIRAPSASSPFLLSTQTLLLCLGLLLPLQRSSSGWNRDRAFDEDPATAKRDRDEPCVDACRNDERRTAKTARFRDRARDACVRVSDARVDCFVEQNAVGGCFCRRAEFDEFWFISKVLS